MTARGKTTETFINKPALLSILMPVYNEYAFIRECIRRILHVALPENVARELVIVDDGSIDGTREILQELAETYPEIRLFFQDRNQGKGAAIRRAIDEMHGDLAIFQDADLEYDPNDYPAVIRPILEGYADVVYGSRYAASDFRRVLFFKHTLGNRFLTFLSNWFTDLNLTDMETCYKAFRGSVLKSIPIRCNGFGLEPEITAKVAKRNCIVYEVPVNYHGRTYAEGKKIGWKDGFKALYTILKYWLIDDCYDEHYGHNELVSLNASTRYARLISRECRKYLGRNVLEVGAGIGNLSRQLAGERHLTVTDSDPGFLDFLQNLFQGREDVSVEKMMLGNEEDQARIAEKKIDTVVALNMLEYQEDDISALKQLKTLLQNDGRLILQVPQYPGLFVEKDKETGNFRRYDKTELKQKLQDAGFNVEVIRSYNWLGLGVWVFNNMILKRRQFGRIQLKLYDSLIPLMRYLLWLPLPGLSLFVVARKTD